MVIVTGWPLFGDLVKSRMGQGCMTEAVVRARLEDWAASSSLTLSCHCLILV